MTVTLTAGGFLPKPLPQSTKLYFPNSEPIRVIYDWIWASQGAGTTDAADISESMNFDEVSLNFYHYISRVYCFTDDGASTLYLRILTDTDRWEDFFYPGHADEQIVLAQFPVNNLGGIDTQYQLNKPISLGQPRIEDADAGDCLVEWNDSVNAKLYNVIIKGFTTEKPLPYQYIQQL